MEFVDCLRHVASTAGLFRFLAASRARTLYQLGSNFSTGCKYSRYPVEPAPDRIPKRREVLRVAQDFASASDAQIVKERRVPVQLARTTERDYRTLLGECQEKVLAREYSSNGK